MAEYLRAVQDSNTAVKCAVRVTDGLHQGSALSLFLFAVVMDRLTDEVR